jgi:signal transduction histidine kinase
VEGALAENGSWRGNLVQQTRNGREIVVACRKTMNRESKTVLEVSRDITVQLKAEDALRESEKLAAMGRVAGIIAHEINNPLAAITNIFYLLRNHPSLNDEARSYAAAAEQELVRVSHITRQTLSFYRESKQPTPVRVHELLDDVAELQNRALQVNKIELRKKYSSASNVTGFPVELRQVFLNLIANAVQAMPSGGTLRLHVHEATDWPTQRRGPAISVIDTGVGIKPEDVRRLFEPFYSTKAAKGTGLGLWISKGILQKYSGRISYRSFRRDGKCVTCFRVFIPGNGTLNLVQDGGDGAASLDRAHMNNGDGEWRASEASNPAMQTTFLS